jgi:TatD DNase family protein
MPGKLVDFHCHLDLYPDFEALVGECEALGVHTLAVTTTPRAWARNHALASRTKHVNAALGLHPQVVGTHGNEIDLWESLLPKTCFVGEVGLDAGPRYYGTLDRQKEIFERVLKACDRAGGKILSVHSIRAASLVLDMVETHLTRGQARVVLHWFTGSASEARRAVDLGCYFSVNSQMAANPRTGKVIADIPRDRILTETDGPFAKTNGVPSRPVNAAESVQSIADARQESVVDVEAFVFENFKAVTGAF